MEIIIELGGGMISHRYVEDKEKAQKEYEYCCKEYGIENVKMTNNLSKFYE